MKLKWFAPKCSYSVCKECGVHFEPIKGDYYSRWTDLCQQHRKPVMERDLKRDKVIAWAGQNWEKLIERVEKEDAERIAAFNAAMQSSCANQWSALQAQQANAQSNLYTMSGMGLNQNLG